jgi:FecR protein
MWLSRLNWFAGFILAAILSAPAWGATPALPGALNYVEGQASIGTEMLNAKSVGSTTLEAGQTLTTETGKAEILMTPGVFFRLSDDSAATLVSPSLTNTEIALSKGQAMVEVDDIHKDNVLRVQEDGAATQLLKTGIYGFDANSGDVRVFKGEALVQDGDRLVKVKGGHELAVNNTGKLKTAKFDEAEYQNTDLYRFSNLRSEYLAEANVDAAGMYWPGGPGWFGAGWYWDPFFWDYTWLPGAGLFYSPFGWGFYSPLWLGYYGGGFYRGYGYGYGHGVARPYAAHGFAGRPGGFRGPEREGLGASHFGVMGGGFHGGGGGFHGGGFGR